MTAHRSAVVGGGVKLPFHVFVIAHHNRLADALKNIDIFDEGQS
jgi:hypothetical protein